MNTRKVLSEREIGEYIFWLETEIDKCLECDLPVNQLEEELIALNYVFLSRTAPKVSQFFNNAQISSN
ncbi:hypothetical protein ACFL60_02100 [Candidatus Omnitrophota bacterium]